MRLLVLFCVSAAVICVDEPWDDDDFYTLLGVEQDAALAVIKRAYRKLSLEHHPDSAGESGKEMFQKLSRAYEILSNSKLRRAYDQDGLDGVEAFEKKEAAGDQHRNDPFAAFFGGGGVKQRPSLNIPLFISLKDLFLGKTIEASVHKQTRCKKCRGTGAKTKKDLHVCPHCKGAGTIVGMHQIGPGMYQQVRQHCPHCEGKGKVIGRKCDHCHGHKVVAGTENISFDVERGMKEGHVVKLENMCDEIAGSAEAPGDINFHIHASHAAFDEESGHLELTRAENDLLLAVPISLKEALVGFKKEFEHLDGSLVDLDRSDRVTPHGQMDKVRGAGMPIHGRMGEYGDLLVTYSVIFPATLTQQQREAIESL